MTDKPTSFVTAINLLRQATNLLSNVISEPRGDATSQPTDQEQPGEYSNSNRFAPYRNNNTQNNSSSSSISTSRRRRSQRATRRVKDTWTHEFLCLGNPNQRTVPSVQKKIELQSAGLGRKKIVFSHKDDGLKFNNTLESAYPKLKLGGGFEILRSGSKNNLVLIPAPVSGYSVPYLRDYSGLGQAMAYIRPIQVSLELSEIEVDEPDEVNY